MQDPDTGLDARGAAQAPAGPDTVPRTVREADCVLVVDTDPAFRAQMAPALSRLGLRAEWRKRLLGLMEDLNEVDPVALVLALDREVGDPLHVLRSLRTNRRWSELPILLVGSEVSRRDELEAYVEGADAVLDRAESPARLAAMLLGHGTRRERRRCLTGRAVADEVMSLFDSDEAPDRVPAPGLEPGPPTAPAPVPAPADPPEAAHHPLLPPGDRAPWDVAMDAVRARYPATASSPPMSGGVPAVTHPAEERPGPPATPEGGVPIGYGSHVPDVIVVEDDPSLSEMLRYALTNRGYLTLSFSNGLDALRGLQTMDLAGHRPVVILDVDLPGLDGFRILQEIASHRPGAFQIVLSTVHNSEATQVLGIQSGAVDYLVKPLRMPIVLAKVERLLGPRSADRAAAR